MKIPMKVCLDCGKSKEASEFYLSKNGKMGLASYCKDCDKARRKAHKDANRERERETDRRWKAAHPDYMKAYLSDYYRANKDEILANQTAYYHETKPERQKTAAAYYEKNSDHLKEKQRNRRAEKPEEVRATRRQHYRDNKATYKANARRREIDKLRATPLWANLVAIEEFYRLAERMTLETGIPHHVDHIVPLRGKTVCGLHVENNLQVITKAANLEKGNRFDPEAKHTWQAQSQ